MKKLVLLGLAGLSLIFGAASESSANGRYCLHYSGNPNCLAVFYDQNYSYAPPPQMVYPRRQIIYYAPPMIRYVQPYVYYGRRNGGGFQFDGSNGGSYVGGGNFMGGGGYYQGGGNFMGGGHHHGRGHLNGGNMGGGKNGGGKNGGGKNGG